MEGAGDHVARIQQEWSRVRPDLDVSPLGVIGRLHRLAAVLTDELVPVFTEHGLTEGDFDVLAALRRSGTAGERAAGDLAAATMVTSGGMTKRLDRLESAGLVARRRSADDGRGRVVSLTSAGRAAIDAAFEAHVANERRLLACLDVGDAEDLERILTTWAERLAAAAPSAAPGARPV